MLFASEPLAGHDDELENRVRLEAAYGQPVFSGSFIADPRTGLIHSTTARDYHLGWRLATPHRSDLSLDIKVLYRDHDGKNPEHVTVFEIIAHW